MVQKLAHPDESHVNDCLFCGIIRGEKEAEFVHKGEAVVAFKDIRPQAPVHILIVPKKAIADMTALSVAERDFMVDLFATVQSLVSEMNLEETGYRLICNGGPYQDVPQLHFHLVSGTF